MKDYLDIFNEAPAGIGGGGSKVNCKQSIIPTVDESEPPCRTYIKAECVIFKDHYTYIGSKTSESLEKVLERLVNKIRKQDAIINDLYNKVRNLGG